MSDISQDANLRACEGILNYYPADPLSPPGLQALIFEITILSQVLRLQSKESEKYFFLLRLLQTHLAGLIIAHQKGKSQTLRSESFLFYLSSLLP